MAPATRDELVACLIRAGELEVSGEDQAETDSYFDTSQFRFHGPGGYDEIGAQPLTTPGLPELLILSDTRIENSRAHVQNSSIDPMGYGGVGIFRPQLWEFADAYPDVAHSQW